MSAVRDEQPVSTSATSPAAAPLGRGTSSASGVVQRRENLRGLGYTAQSAALAPAEAAEGTAGSGASLPHLDRIQTAFASESGAPVQRSGAVQRNPPGGGGGGGGHPLAQQIGVKSNGHELEVGREWSKELKDIPFVASPIMKGSLGVGIGVKPFAAVGAGEHGTECKMGLEGKAEGKVQFEIGLVGLATAGVKTGIDTALTGKYERTGEDVFIGLEMTPHITGDLFVQFGPGGLLQFSYPVLDLPILKAKLGFKNGELKFECEPSEELTAVWQLIKDMVTKGPITAIRERIAAAGAQIVQMCEDMGQLARGIGLAARVIGEGIQRNLDAAGKAIADTMDPAAYKVHKNYVSLYGTFHGEDPDAPTPDDAQAALRQIVGLAGGRVKAMARATRNPNKALGYYFSTPVGEIAGGGAAAAAQTLARAAAYTARHDPNRRALGIVFGNGDALLGHTIGDLSVGLGDSVIAAPGDREAVAAAAQPEEESGGGAGAEPA